MNTSGNSSGRCISDGRSAHSGPRSEKYYNGGDVKALDGVTADICKGDVMAVIGPSGGGKSTFLRSLNLLETPTSGSIIFDGVDITGKKVDLPLHRQKWAWCSNTSICSPTEPFWTT